MQILCYGSDSPLPFVRRNYYQQPSVPNEGRTIFSTITPHDSANTFPDFSKPTIFLTSRRENFFPREVHYIKSRHQIKLIYILHSFFYSLYKLDPVIYWDPQMFRHLTGLRKKQSVPSQCLYLLKKSNTILRAESLPLFQDFCGPRSYVYCHFLCHKFVWDVSFQDYISFLRNLEFPLFHCRIILRAEGSTTQLDSDLPL